jgi:hypothetical protein
MRSFVRTFALLALAVPAAAPAQDRGPVDRGSWLVGGSAGFTRETVETESNEGTVTQFGVSPDLLYFVADRLALGGRLSLNWLDTDGGGSNGWLLGPAARLYFAPSAARTLPFVGLGVSLGKVNFESDVTDDEGGTSSWGLEAIAGLTWMASRQVGLTMEGFYDRVESEFDAGALDSETTRSTFGVRFGFAAFLFR